MTYKPDSYTDLSPYLIVSDIETALTFVSDAFGGERLRVMHRPDGSPMHAEARIGDSVVMFGQDASAGPSAAHVHVYVPDVNATYAAALAAGAGTVQVPSDQGDGDLRAGLRDPLGTTWWPSTRTDSN